MDDHCLIDYTLAADYLVITN